MPALPSSGAISPTFANASCSLLSRVPLSIAKLCRPGGAADHTKSSGPTTPTSSADVSSAPVRSSARSFSDGMRSAQQAPAGEILHHRAEAEGPVLALIAVAHAVDELAKLGRANGNDIVALVGKALPRRVAVLHRREHRAEEQRKSVRVLVHGADCLRHQV